MSQLVIELSEPLSKQIKASGLTQRQLGKVMGYLLETYLKMAQMKEFNQVVSTVELQKNGRKAGSAKNLGIVMADDFDEPLDDFAEYMR